MREEGAQGATIVSVLYNRVLYPDGSLGKNPVWEEGHKFGFGHEEFEVLLRHQRDHVKKRVGLMSVGFG